MAKVLLLVASATERSRSLNLGVAIEESLKRPGIDTELIDLRELRLPIYDVTVEKSDAYDDKTRAFLYKSQRAAGFIWVTPVYHNSFSSLIKTALDWQHFFMDGRTVGMASQGGNRNTSAVDQLLVVARSQHLVAIPTRVCTDNQDYDEQKQLTAPDILERVDRFTREFTDFLSRFKP